MHDGGMTEKNICDRRKLPFCGKPENGSFRFFKQMDKASAVLRGGIRMKDKGHGRGIGKLYKEMREYKNLTQGQVAAHLMTQRSLSNFEQGG